MSRIIYNGEQGEAYSALFTGAATVIVYGWENASGEIKVYRVQDLGGEAIKKPCSINYDYVSNGSLETPYTLSCNKPIVMSEGMTILDIIQTGSFRLDFSDVQGFENLQVFITELSVSPTDSTLGLLTPEDCEEPEPEPEPEPPAPVWTSTGFVNCYTETGGFLLSLEEYELIDDTGEVLESKHIVVASEDPVVLVGDVADPDSLTAIPCNTKLLEVKAEHPSCWEDSDGNTIALTEVKNTDLLGEVTTSYSVMESKIPDVYPNDLLLNLEGLTRIQCVPCCSVLPVEEEPEPVEPRRELILRGALLGSMLNPIQPVDGTLSEDSPNMRTTLQEKNKIPLASPYSSGVSTTQEILDANEIVDWVEAHVFIDGTGTTYDMLMKSDGYLITHEGINIKYTESDVGDVVTEVSLNHRNHMGGTLITNEALLDDVTTIDTMYGDYDVWNDGNSSITKDRCWYEMSDGGYCLWAGDPSADNKIKYQGANNDENYVIGYVYQDPDNPSNDTTFITRLYVPADVALRGRASFDPDQGVDPEDSVEYSSESKILEALLYAYPTNTTNDINFDLATSVIKTP